MIGRAKLDKGLYHLQHSSCNQFFVNNILNHKKLDSEMWHFRLGHPSNKVLELLCKIVSYICIDSKYICDVCNFLKQYKLPFQLSNSSTTNAFSLIYILIIGVLSLLLLFTAIDFFLLLLIIVLHIL